MLKNILEKLEYIRSYLEEDTSTLVFAEIITGKVAHFYNVNDPLKDYYELLNMYSYLSCGSILIFGYDKLDELQYYLTEVPDLPSNWKCIGKSHTYPIFINVNDCTVKVLEGEPWTGWEFKSYGHLNDFIEQYVIGCKYKELWGEDDWYNFLVNIGMA